MRNIRVRAQSVQKFWRCCTKIKITRTVELRSSKFWVIWKAETILLKLSTTFPDISIKKITFSKPLLKRHFFSHSSPGCHEDEPLGVCVTILAKHYCGQLSNGFSPLRKWHSHLVPPPRNSNKRLVSDSVQCDGFLIRNTTGSTQACRSAGTLGHRNINRAPMASIVSPYAQRCLK